MIRRLVPQFSVLLLMTAAAILTAGALVREVFPIRAQPVSVDWTAEWLKAPERGHQSFFRRMLEIPFIPQNAWVAVSSNDYVLFVNGQQVARNRYVNNIGVALNSRINDRHQALNRRTLETVRAPELRRTANQEKSTPLYTDISSFLRPGPNLIAIAIEDTSKSPSFSLSGGIRGQGRHISLDSSAEDWTAATVPRHVDGEPWNRALASYDGWASAVRSDEDHRLLSATDPRLWSVPPPTARMSGHLIGQSVTFQRTITGLAWHGIERGAWLRIKTTWPYSILIDGRLAAEGAPSSGLQVYDITAFLDRPESTVRIQLTRPATGTNRLQSPLLVADAFVDGRHLTGAEGWWVRSSQVEGFGSWRPATVASEEPGNSNVRLKGEVRPYDWSDRMLSAWVVVMAGALSVWALAAFLFRPLADDVGLVPGRLAGSILAIPAITAVLVAVLRLRFQESDTLLWFYEPGTAALLAAATVASFGAAVIMLNAKPGRRRPAQPSRNGSITERTTAVILLILIMALGLYLRMLNIGLENLQADENVSYDAARGILRTGLPEAVSGVLYTRSPLYHYLLAGWLMIFGDTVEVARSFSVLAGVGAIGAVYRLATLMGASRPLALLLALWIAADPWQITVSRNIRFYQQMQFFGLLSFSLFLQGFILDHDRRLQTWFFICVTAATLSQEVFVTMFPGFCIAGYFYYRPFRLTEDWRIILGTVTVLTITIVDLIIFQVMCLTPHVGVGTTSGSILQLHTLDISAFTVAFLNGTLRSHFFITTLLILALFLRPKSSSAAVGVGMVLIIVGIIVTTVLVVQIANRYLFVIKPLLVITVAVAVREIVLDWSERLFVGRTTLKRWKVFSRTAGAVELLRPPKLRSVRDPARVERAALDLLKRFHTRFDREFYRRRWQRMIFALLIGAGVADSEIWRTVTSYEDVTILQHEDAYEYIAENMRPGDKVVSVSPMSAAIVLGQLDYYLMEKLSFDEVYMSGKQGIIDRWSGGHLISNVERLHQVFLENERVWVLLNIQERPRFTAELLNFIHISTESQKAFFGGEVYLWERSAGRHFPVANRQRSQISF